MTFSGLAFSRGVRTLQYWSMPRERARGENQKPPAARCVGKRWAPAVFFTGRPSPRIPAQTTVISSSLSSSHEDLFTRMRGETFSQGNRHALRKLRVLHACRIQSG